MTESSALARRWPAEGFTRIPTWIYSDPDIFRREMDVFFEGPTWSAVGLDCEVPEPGSFKRSWIGTRPVLVVRDQDGAIQVLENRCAHRGTLVCWQLRGRAETLTCPYHQWTYDLQGRLLGLPFLRGALGRGGMPKDFDRGRHGMRRLRCETRGGLIFASFDDDAPDLDRFVGPEMLTLVDRVFSGRALRLIGYSRQLLPCNWKLYLENSRDPYHATLLHSFFLTFGLLRTDTPFRNAATEQGRHGIMASRYSASTASTTNAVTQELRSLKQFTLEDLEVVKPVDEFGDSSMVNLSLLPGLFLQQHGNSLALRHIIPKGVDQTELSWTFFGYEDDDDDMRRRRRKQANLVGPAGYVAADDSEVLATVQAGVTSAPETVQVIEMGGRDTEPKETMVSETLLRAFYDFYRPAMGL